MSDRASSVGGAASPLLVGQLFDRVIQRVFTAGMLLNGALHDSTPAAALSIEQAIGELDEVLRDIRAATFTAPAPAPRDPDLRAASADFDVAAASLDEVAAAITRLVAAQLLDGACTLDLVDAAHSAHRARLAVEEARSARSGRGVRVPTVPPIRRDGPPSQ